MKIKSKDLKSLLDKEIKWCMINSVGNICCKLGFISGLQQAKRFVTKLEKLLIRRNNEKTRNHRMG